MMAWWNFIGGILKGGKDVAEVFVENKEKRGQRKHVESMADINRDIASLEQFSGEFHQRRNRTGWDSFVDGLNRLPRPLLTIGILSFFILAPLDPAKFIEIARAYELIPPGYWALVSVIIGFYFGGRMQLKSQDMAIRKEAVKAQEALIREKESFRQLEIEEQSQQAKIFDKALATGKQVIQNKVVANWLQSRQRHLKLAP